MAGLPWIQLASDWRGSKKAITLRVFLQDEWAWAYPVSLWMWTAQHEGDGRIEGPGCVAVIAEAAGWRGNPQDFVDAMVRTGLLDEISGGYYVHDWHDYAGSHIEKRKKERTRLASYRERTRTARVQNEYVQEKNADVHGERERERETDTETISLSPREQGAAARLEILSPKPRTHELLVELDRRGFECRPPAKAPATAAVEKILGSVPVSVAADRVMAVVDADRRMSVVPRDTLGWYLDAIRGQPEGGRRAGKQQSNPQTGVAVPADASAFGEGGQRAIE